MNQLIKSITMPGKYEIRLEEAESFNPYQPLSGYRVVVQGDLIHNTYETMWCELNLALAVFDYKLAQLEGE
jgi:hypothetical protein